MFWRERYSNITTSLRQFLDAKSSERNALAARTRGQPAACAGKKSKDASAKNVNNAPNAAHATLPAMFGAKTNGAPQLTDSPLRDPARPPNNPWIFPPKFTMLFNPEHMKSSKATSRCCPLPPSPAHFPARPKLSHFAEHTLCHTLRNTHFMSHFAEHTQHFMSHFGEPTLCHTLHTHSTFDDATLRLLQTV